MPKQVLPTLDQFVEFTKKMIDNEFDIIRPGDVSKKIRRFNLKAPRKQEGQEIGFRSMSNGLTVIVWTTWIESLGRAAKSDTGWVSIAHATTDKRLYHDRPTHRTENFLTTLLDRALIAKWRIDNRPVCYACGHYMSITRGKGMKGRCWTCNRLELHQNRKLTSKPWDDNLPAEMKKLVEGWRERYNRYATKAGIAGKDRHQAMQRRKTWQAQKAS